MQRIGLPLPGIQDLVNFTTSSNITITSGPTLTAPPGADLKSWRY